MKEEVKPYMRYAMILTQAVAEITNEDSEYYIDLDEVAENGEETEFCHALLNVMPSLVSSDIFGTPSNLLDSNHIANKLCFKFSNK